MHLVAANLAHIEPTSTQCYVDESVYRKWDFVVSAFVFTKGRTDQRVARVLRDSGLRPGIDEFKSGTRMVGNPTMQRVREAMLSLANSTTRIGIYVGPLQRGTLGKHTLQALQSIVVRNSITPSKLDVYFDQDIFSSSREAHRLHSLFHYLKATRIHSMEDSRKRLGIQIADVVAASFGQIVKEAFTGKVKDVDIGGPNTGYSSGTMAPLGWSLLMILRRALLTRPMVYGGEKYSAAADPVVLDPVHDDPVNYGQHPILLGWGIQVAPEASDELRLAVQDSLGRIWLGCIH
jgi:hypothetical protein